MRTLPLITTIVLLFGNGSALGLKVDKKIEAPGAPAQIWEIAGDFCAIKAWHPLVADCKQTNEGDTVLRTLTAKNGPKPGEPKLFFGPVLEPDRGAQSSAL